MVNWQLVAFLKEKKNAATLKPWLRFHIGGPSLRV